MNKTELVAAVADKTGFSKNVCDITLRAIIEATEEAVQKGDSVALVGFGTFSSVKRSARTGRNPLTGKSMKIAEKMAPKFKAGKAFKEMVNSKPKKAAKKK